MEERPQTGRARTPADRQSHGQQHRARPRANPAANRQHQTPTPTRLSLTCSPRWRTTSRLWQHKLPCSNSTPSKQDSTKVFNNRLSRCPSRQQTTWPLASSSSHSCRKTHKAPTHSRCSSSSYHRNSNCSRNSQAQDSEATHRSPSARKTALHQYPKTACQTSRSSSSRRKCKCNSPPSPSLCSNSPHPPTPSANPCYRI